LAEHLAVLPAQVITCSNGTTALTAALLELTTRGQLCAMPAWTFAATAHAAIGAGLTPWLLDVREDTQALDAEDVRRSLSRAPGPVGAVLLVSPFGQPLDLDPWADLQRETGLPVVVDAAAAMFDTVVDTGLATVVSLHATKPLGIGEGAFLLAPAAHEHQYRRRVTFGFDGTREAQVAAVNGKMTEYAAAIGNAALAVWPETRAELFNVAAAYEDAFQGTAVRTQVGWGRDWASGTAVVTLPACRLRAVETALAAARIGTRRWWGNGLAGHRAFAKCPRVELSVTDKLAGTSLGLPFWRDLPKETINLVVKTVREALS
jgi:dTDP-4-amino-4,6-dideoxygalactose transaminase